MFKDYFKTKLFFKLLELDSDPLGQDSSSDLRPFSSSPWPLRLLSKGNAKWFGQARCLPHALLPLLSGQVVPMASDRREGLRPSCTGSCRERWPASLPPSFLPSFLYRAGSSVRHAGMNCTLAWVKSFCGEEEMEFGYRRVCVDLCSYSGP